MINVKRIVRYARAYRSEVDSLWSAYKIGWLVAKAPAGLNERDLEWPWVIQELVAEQGRDQKRVLDIGSYNTPFPATVGKLGFEVVALDCNAPDMDHEGGLHVVASDIRNASFADNMFDVATCVSTLEHIGVKGRYGVTVAEADGDTKAMREIHRILKPAGRALITIPFGRRDVLPVNRCYNKKRIKDLFQGFKIAKERYFKYIEDRRWTACSAGEAQMVNWFFSPWYALACYHLIKVDAEDMNRIDPCAA